jgi:energy-coupling factor transporter ATP-binding protein EcfA2
LQTRIPKFGGLSVAVGIATWLLLTRFTHWAAITNVAISGLSVLLAIAIAFGRKVYKELESRWVPRLADRADQLIEAAVSDFRREYLEYIHSVHHDVDLKGLTTIGNYSLSVEQVFVDLSLAPEPLHLAKGSVVKPDTPRTRTSSAEHAAMAERHSIWYFIENTERRGARLAIIGPPGAGKTTLMKHLVGVLATNRAPDEYRNHIPVFLYLREHADQIAGNENVSVSRVVRESLSLLDSEEPPRWFEEQLGKGQCVVLLDGLDEVASREQRGKIVAWVDRQMAAYPDCTWIVTSRPLGYRSRPLNSATVLQVRPFTETQVNQFLAGWYSATHVRSAARDDVGVRLRAERECADLVGRLHQNAAILDLATNPLLLTMIAHVHFYRGALPGSRAELYKEMCQVLLGNRQEAKGLQLRLSTAKNHLLACSLAYRMMVDGVRDIRTSRAEQVLRPVLRSVGTDIGAETFLQELEASSGLLLEKEAGKYAFAHLTLQEYLAAAHIKERQGVRSLLPHVDNEWWREVHLLYASQADATPLIEKCLSLGDPPPVHALVLALDCLDLAVEVDPKTRTKLLLTVQRETARGGTAHRDSMLAVQFVREMRNWVRIAEDTYSSSRVLKVSECEFLLEHRPLVASLSQVDGEPLGIPFDRDQVKAIVAMVNNILGSTWLYRLPREAEIAYIPKVVDDILKSDGLWIEDEGIARICNGPRVAVEDVPELLCKVVGRLIESTGRHSILRTGEHADTLSEFSDMLKTGRASTSSSVGIAPYAVILTFKRELSRLGHLSSYQTLSLTRHALLDAQRLLAELVDAGPHGRYPGQIPLELVSDAIKWFDEGSVDGISRQDVCEALDHSVCYLVLAWFECNVRERDISTEQVLRISEHTSSLQLDVLRRAESPLLRALCGVLWLDASMSSLARRGGAVLLVRDAGPGAIS